MRVHKHIVILTILSAFPFFINAQSSLSTIRGTVIDAKTGGGIPSINIYLANTTIGTTTDSNGNYKLNIPVTGDYDLVFSFVGYKRKVFRVQLEAGSSLRYNVQLTPEVMEMEELEVISSNKEWKENYDFFAEEFLGETEFAELATIKNPWVIDFREGENNTLIASANEPLVIVNKALGYTIHAELIEFAWNRRSKGGAYQVYSRYEELEAENDIQKQIWLVNRRKTYYGSLLHFLKSLYHDRIEEEHFSVQRPNNIQALSEGEKKFELIGRPNVSSQKLKKLRGFRIHQKVEISFDHTVELQFGSSTIEVPVDKDSSIEGNTEKELFFVQENGTLLNPISIKLYGDWAKSRVANSLPDNFSPDN